MDLENTWTQKQRKEVKEKKRKSMVPDEKILSQINYLIFEGTASLHLHLSHQVHRRCMLCVLSTREFCWAGSRRKVYFCSGATL